MSLLVSETRIAVADAAGLAARFIAHMAEHDVPCETQDGRTVMDLGVGAGIVEVAEGRLEVRVEADDLGKLELLRSYVAEHVVEFADGAQPAIAWRGNAAVGETFSDFREVRLVCAIDLTPRMKRLTFAGDVSRFDSRADLHVRLYFPPAGLAVPEWPRPGHDGRTIWPADERRPEVRYYTVRRVDHDRGEIEIDFVLHSDPGPGADFAAAAREGAICGMAGPLGRAAPAAAWTLLAGDETALPAIARMLEAMPEEARGVVLIEIEDAADETPLDHPAGVAVTWLTRDGATAGAPLVKALSALQWPDEPDSFAWVACEYGASKTIRRQFKARGLTRETALVVGYWEREERRSVAA